jgi:AcrR family transcriptional regulator
LLQYKLAKKPRKKRQKQQTKQTKQKLTDSFWELYCSKPIEKISIQEIASGAGYSRGTFYKYFTDVHDILEQFESSLLRKLESSKPTDFLSSAELNPIEKLVLLFEEDSKYYTILLGNKGDPSFISKMKSTLKPEFIGLLIEHNDEKFNRHDYIIEYNLSAMIGLLNYCYSQEMPLCRQEIIELILDMM